MCCCAQPMTAWRFSGKDGDRDVGQLSRPMDVSHAFVWADPGRPGARASVARCAQTRDARPGRAVHRGDQRRSVGVARARGGRSLRRCDDARLSASQRTSGHAGGHRQSAHQGLRARALESVHRSTARRAGLFDARDQRGLSRPARILAPDSPRRRKSNRARGRSGGQGRPCENDARRSQRVEAYRVRPAGVLPGIYDEGPRRVRPGQRTREFGQT